MKNQNPKEAFQETQKILTEPGRRYWHEHGLLLEYVELFNAIFSFGIMYHAMKKKDGIKNFLSIQELPNTPLIYIKNTLNTWETVTSTLYPKFMHRQVIWESALCRIVENFLSYLKELLRIAFLTHPELLRSKEQEQIDYILQYHSMEDLITALAEKKIEQLSFEGTYALLKYFEKHGLALLKNEKAKEELNLFISMRNIIVHNRGIVNDVFLQRVKNYPATLNKPLQIDYSFFRRLNYGISDFAMEIDTRAAKHWNLPTAKYTIMLPITTFFVDAAFTETNIKEYFTESVYAHIDSDNSNK